MSTMNGPVHVNGHLSSDTFGCPAGAIQNAAIAVGAAIAHTKVNRLVAARRFIEGALSTATYFIALIEGVAGEITGLKAFLKVASTGAATVTIDVRKNGSSILSTVLTLDDSHAAYEVVNHDLNEFTSVDVMQDDVLEITVTPTAGGGVVGTGLGVGLTIRELWQ